MVSEREASRRKQTRRSFALVTPPRLLSRASLCRPLFASLALCSMSDFDSPGKGMRKSAGGKAPLKRTASGRVIAAAAKGVFSPTADSEDEEMQSKSRSSDEEEPSPPVSLAASTREDDDDAEVSVSPPVLKRKRALASKTVKAVEEDEEDDAEAVEAGSAAVRERSVSRGRSMPRTVLFSALTDRRSSVQSLRDRLRAASRQLLSLRFGVGSVLLGALALTLVLLVIGASLGIVRFGGSSSSSHSPSIHLSDLEPQQSPSASSLLRQIRSTVAEIRAAQQRVLTSSPS